MPALKDQELEGISGGMSPYFTYTVVSGDTLSAISLRFHSDVVTLKRLNNISDPNKLEAKRVLLIPR